MKTKTITLSIIFILALILNVRAQKTYADFHATYQPHNKLFKPDDESVQLMTQLTLESVINMMESYAKKGDKNAFQLYITSFERETAGKILDQMSSKICIKGLNLMDKEWLLDVAYYASESTYNKVSGSVDILKNY